jgi:hypothetical protein
MTDYERSAIIGFWRSGCSFMEIQFITGIPAYHIEKIINEYLASKNEKLE